MRERIIRSHLRRSVVLTLKTGEGFHGVLFDADRAAVVLRNAASIETSGTDRIPVTVDGELVVLRGDIAYMQFA